MTPKYTHKKLKRKRNISKKLKRNTNTVPKRSQSDSITLLSLFNVGLLTLKKGHQATFQILNWELLQVYN